MADNYSSDEIKEMYDEFKERVNMTGKELEEWLETDESKSVGDSDSGESTGHQMGREILKIKDKKQDDLDDDDYEAMRKVVNYQKRHLAQGPDDDVEHSDWRYSLMNWGHDPLKD